MNELSAAAQQAIRAGGGLNYGAVPVLVLFFLFGLGIIVGVLWKARGDDRFIPCVIGSGMMLFSYALLSDDLGLNSTASVGERRATLVAIDNAQRQKADGLAKEMQTFSSAISEYVEAETMGDVVKEALLERFVSFPSCTILRSGYLFSERQEGIGEMLNSSQFQYFGQSTPDFNGEESAYLLIETDSGWLRVIAPGRSYVTGITAKLLEIETRVGDYPTHVGVAVKNALPAMLLPVSRFDKRNYAQIDAVIGMFETGHRVAAIDGYVLHSQNDDENNPTVIVAERIEFVDELTRVERFSVVEKKKYRFPAIVIQEAVRGFLEKRIENKWFTLSIPSDRVELEAMRKQYDLK